MRNDRETAQLLASMFYKRLAPLGFGVECRFKRGLYGAGVFELKVQYRVACGPPVQTLELTMTYGMHGRETDDWAQYFVAEKLHGLFKVMTDEAHKYALQQGLGVPEV